MPRISIAIIDTNSEDCPRNYKKDESDWECGDGYGSHSLVKSYKVIWRKRLPTWNFAKAGSALFPRMANCLLHDRECPAGRQGVDRQFAGTSSVEANHSIFG